MFCLLVIQIVNTVESVTLAGLPITFNQLSGRPQIAQEAGSERSCIIPIHPGHEQAAGSEGSSGELPLNQQDPPTEIRIWNVILLAKETFDLFLQYLGYKLNVFVRSHDVGSLLITVECESLQILEGLWEDYRSGHLNEITQEILVTAEVLEKLGLDEVKLKTFICKEEYEKGKQIFIENSGVFIILNIKYFPFLSLYIRTSFMTFYRGRPLQVQIFSSIFCHVSRAN